MMLDFGSDGAPDVQFATEEGDQFIIDGLSVVLAGRTSVLGDLGTGVVVWAAGPALAEALCSSQSDTLSARAYTGMRAIELGCGCAALPSLALALADVKVEATDIAELMSALEVNLERFASAATAQAHSSASHIRDNLIARTLDWYDDEALAAMALGDGYDLVVASDLDYSGELLDRMIRCLCVTLSRRPGSAALFASAANCGQANLDEILSKLRIQFVVDELAPSLLPMAAEQRHDRVHFFSARWPSASVAAEYSLPDSAPQS